MKVSVMAPSTIRLIEIQFAASLASSLAIVVRTVVVLKVIFRLKKFVIVQKVNKWSTKSIGIKYR